MYANERSLFNQCYLQLSLAFLFNFLIGFYFVWTFIAWEFSNYVTSKTFQSNAFLAFNPVRMKIF